jgi:hypothetical protein
MTDYATNMSKSIVHTTKRLTQMIDEVRQKQEQAERDEIIKMAQEACDPDKVDAWKNGFWTLTQEELERIVRAAEQAEREACAKVCDDKNTLLAWPTCADAIRARGEK